MRKLLAALCLPLPLLALPCAAQAQEVFTGVYVHNVDTPFSLPVHEDGADVALGYRFKPVEALGAIGSPAPYVIASLNTAGDTSFVGGGLSWSLGKGPVYFRPAIGMVIHDAPGYRVEDGLRTDLGSRVLFEPEVALGYRLNQRLSLEASWMHVSHARLFNSEQNPGIDMMGARLNLKL